MNFDLKKKKTQYIKGKDRKIIGLDINCVDFLET